MSLVVYRHVIKRQYATIKRAPWSNEETQKLINLVKEHGKAWSKFEHHFPNRSQAALYGRYEYLEKNATKNIEIPASRRVWTEEEDGLLLELIKEYGPKWTKISKYMQNRSPNKIVQRYKILEKKDLNEDKTDWTKVAEKIKTDTIGQNISRHQDITDTINSVKPETQDNWTQQEIELLIELYKELDGSIELIQRVLNKSEQEIEIQYRKYVSQKTEKK